MDYYLGGYYLVEGCPRPDYMAAFLPPTIWSISGCVCSIYPDIWALPWVRSTHYDRPKIQQRLGLTAPAFQAMQTWVDQAFTEQRFGWPNIWLDYPSAI
jgi:hypothetical protein